MYLITNNRYILPTVSYFRKLVLRFSHKNSAICTRQTTHKEIVILSQFHVLQNACHTNPKIAMHIASKI